MSASMKPVAWQYRQPEYTDGPLVWGPWKTIESELQRDVVQKHIDDGADIEMRQLFAIDTATHRIVPISALKWLNGEEDTFEPPADQWLFRGKVPTYWWRSEFRRRCGDDVLAAATGNEGEG